MAETEYSLVDRRENEENFDGARYNVKDDVCEEKMVSANNAQPESFCRGCVLTSSIIKARAIQFLIDCELLRGQKVERGSRTASRGFAKEVSTRRFFQEFRTVSLLL
jgi:hypothetical protein